MYLLMAGDVGGRSGVFTQAIVTGQYFLSSIGQKRRGQEGLFIAPLLKSVVQRLESVNSVPLMRVAGSTMRWLAA